MAATIKNTSKPVSLGSGQSGTIFSGVSIDDPLILSPALSGGGSGYLSVTLRSSGGPVGTLTDPETRIVQSPTVTYAGDSMTWGARTYGGPHPGAGVFQQADGILDRLVYTAPEMPAGSSKVVFGDVSFTPSVNGQTAGMPTVREMNAMRVDLAGASLPVPRPVDVVSVPDPAPVPTPQPTPTPTPQPAPAPAPVVAAEPAATAPVPAPVPALVTTEPAPVAAAPVPQRFAVVNASTGVASTSLGEAGGGVSGIDWTFIAITPESLAITAAVPNVFIRTGSGNDLIDVWAAGGTNVLDGGEGSNFLTGGSGFDTFFVDARNAAGSTWSTVRNLGQGDAATLWGIKATDALRWVDMQGAEGAKGLTLHADVGGKPTASLTLSGFASNDLASGRLGVSFGNVGGADYMYVRAA